jgi:glyceraldehyde 3-phosphate dehydrogenase
MAIRVGINGFGRIGRAIFRINLKKHYFDIVSINDINPDNKNIAYLLKYDSTYGRIEDDIISDDNGIVVNDNKVSVYHHADIADVPWGERGVDIVIDSSGVRSNLFSARKLRKHGIKHCVVTNSPEEVDITVIVSVNESEVDKEKHFLISGSICDANAFVPVANVLEREFGIEHGFLTTLHPWLGYQNLLDGPSISYATPGKIYDHYALGRSSSGSLIPKTTSAISASCKVLKYLQGKFLSLSYRVPTAIVSSCDISVKLNKITTAEEIKELFIEEARKQKLDIFYNNIEGLVSVDFTGFDYSSIIDHRWIMMNGSNYLKMILWYDNEWGYSSRVVDLVNYLGSI